MNKLIIKNATELVTCKGNAPNHGSAPKKGTEMSDVGIIKNGAVVIEDGIIVAVGATNEILSKFDEKNYEVFDAANKAVLPGFVDSHTHLIFGGYRADEFSWRLRGDTYMSIMERGGGITNSVRGTREESLENLVEIGRKRLHKMMQFGVTTVEGKSGYGL
ncbi:MAG TPA: imidazolonepropionase, partial [Clostridiales bacterium]|nr:imidazolonepropionase [Clostridiales bacterium]